MLVSLDLPTYTALEPLPLFSLLPVSRSLSVLPSLLKLPEVKLSVFPLYLAEVVIVPLLALLSPPLPVLATESFALPPLFTTSLLPLLMPALLPSR
jgi:hypothetical protein